MRRVTFSSAALLIVLRIAIGWQLFYEGQWKLRTLDSSRPWSAAGYLKNSQGLLRDHFRSLAGDPDDLGWLDYDKVAARWDAWHRRFVEHYELDERQQRTLGRWLNGSEYFTAELSELPPGVDFKALRLDSVVSYDPKRKLLKVDGKKHLRPDEKQKLLDAVDPNDEAVKSHIEAVNMVYKRSKDGLSFRERLAATVRGNPDWISNTELQQIGKIDKYRTMLASYEAELKNADTDFQRDHLQYRYGEIQKLRAQMVGSVRGLDKDLKSRAQSLLMLKQLKRGAVPQPWTPLRIADTATIAGLTILGAMLILGLGTRLAALLAAVMVFMFYMAMPPWPGLPEPPGPDHSLIVDKNLIEVCALLVIAALPTGRWFGADALLGWLFRGRR